MDFIERLTERVNRIPNLPVVCKIGYPGTGESLSVNSLPGSQITQTYMDGTTDQRLNYEFAMKSKYQSKIHETMWLIQNELEQLKDLKSNDNSFEFQDLVITDKPFDHYVDEQGWFVFLFSVQANITVFKEDK